MSFETFYKLYPRKKKPRYARQCYESALKRATHEEIMAGLAAMVAAGWEDIQFVPYPSSWLNGDCWLEEHESPKEDYGFNMQGGEKHNLTAFVANGIWRDAWGVKPESWAAAKARLDEINAPRHGLKVVG